MLVEKLGIELKKVKIFDEMSEETVAFVAEVYKDGKRLAEVSNDGKGGCHRWLRQMGVPYSEIEPFTNLDAECDITYAAIQDVFIRKNQNKNLCLLKGDELYKVKLPESVPKLKKKSNYKSWMDTQVYNFEDRGYQILNRNL